MAQRLVHAEDPDYTTSARELTELRVLRVGTHTAWGQAALNFGIVEVTRRSSPFCADESSVGRVLGEEPLDLPPRTLRTKAVWWTLSPQAVTCGE